MAHKVAVALIFLTALAFNGVAFANVSSEDEFIGGGGYAGDVVVIEDEAPPAGDGVKPAPVASPPVIRENSLAEPSEDPIVEIVEPIIRDPEAFPPIVVVGPLEPPAEEVADRAERTRGERGDQFVERERAYRTREGNEDNEPGNSRIVRDDLVEAVPAEPMIETPNYQPPQGDGVDVPQPARPTNEEVTTNEGVTTHEEVITNIAMGGHHIPPVDAQVNNNVGGANAPAAAVPEPASLLLLGGALLGGAFRLRRRA
jgi:hypothetical protein